MPRSRNESVFKATIENIHDLFQNRRQTELDIQEKLQDVCIASDIFQIDKLFKFDFKTCEFLKLTSEEKKNFIEHISRNGHGIEISIKKFNLRFTLDDLSTLVDLNWLNETQRIHFPYSMSYNKEQW